MRTSLGIAVVFVLALGLLPSARCRRQLQANEPMCNSKPPNGTWLLDGFVPTRRDSPDLIRYARNLLFMTEVESNFYIGDWSGVYFLSGLSDLYNGTQMDFHVAAFFNQCTCVFSGTLFNLRREPRFPDVIEFIYDGQAMAGRYIFSQEDPFGSWRRDIFPQFGFHTGTHIGNP